MKEKKSGWEFRTVPDDSGHIDFFSHRWYCPHCGRWQTYGEVPFCPYCGHPVKTDEPVTNADKIRLMPDDELATWLNTMQSNAWYRGRLHADIVHYPDTNLRWSIWLKQEAVASDV